MEDVKGVEGECILWTKYKNRGYGVRWDPVQKRRRPAHRMAYEEQVGPIPEGLDIDHLCFNRACVNVKHLEPVTKAENSRREAARLNTGMCLRGHAYTPENTYINKQGFRSCLICRRAAVRRYQARLRETG